MRITKFGHACVRVEHDGTALVLDPGAFTPDAAAAVDGVAGVLVTHEHADHWTPDALRAADAPIWTIAAVAERIREQAPDLAERVTVVTPGQQLAVAGLPVQVVGEKHAVIHPELPHFDNSGYVLTCGDERVYHPGDALTGPGVDVDVLLAPVCAPWMAIAEGIEFARSVRAPRVLAIHDKVYSDLALGIVDQHFGRFLGQDGLEFVRRADGADL
ncbi:metal-dependent hydrolase [Nocardioides dokdonensis FR1436]|uniref:Metal-dependent hydrolase n=1 Tax=Nocardioides dokdonensis FR1436 TaxID=1300347 RepID=A0A1A9GIG4_9ACTN|nr:MBL fold metallo-hydrolase [Nocardioides dokdonensis]ANH37235.1 metal-dependent hydrolase [Nocardioides dokdonensis FR1436]